MSVSTLRPNGTPANDGSVVGAASAHAATADNSDASYVEYDAGEATNFYFGDLSLPAGAVISRVALRYKVARTSAGTSIIQATVTDLVDDTVSANQVVSWTSPTGVTVKTWDGEWEPGHPFDDASIDALLLSFFISASTVRLYEVYLDVTYVEKPEPTVTAPADEATVEGTNRPNISWTPGLDPDGSAQTHYEVAVVADGDDPDTDPIVAGSGVLAGNATSWQVDEPLPDGTYDCYVRVAQTVNSAQHWSDWSTKSDFAIDVLLPGEPSLTLVPETSSGRMRLDIESDTGGDATTDVFEVQASYDGGETFATIRTPEGWGLATPESDAAMLWDREGGNGQEVVYRVRAGHNYSGLFGWSAWVEDTGAWGPTRTCWLKHPLDAGQDLAVRIDAYGESSIAARQSQMHPLGRSSVIIAADKHGPETGAVTFLLPDQDARDALKTLLRANPATPFLLQVGAADKRPDRWVIFGQIDTAYIVDKSWIDDTRETLGWVEVARP